MDLRRFTLATLVLTAMVLGNASRPAEAAEAPTPARALTLTPIQGLVEYTIPSREEVAQCTIRPEKENNTTSWVVRSRAGEVLRRFADTNNDNVVDQWCYFLGGLEVYRDIDSNYNGKADEYRWFNTAGTRWGIDKNEDGRIDLWRVISPHEVAEQVVFALKTRDASRFALLLLTPEELASLGFGKARTDAITETIKVAPAAFSKLSAEQKTVTTQSRYVDFGCARPATIPLGTGGATKEITICDSASALVQTDDKHDQVSLGTLVSVGNTWKLVAAPALGGDNQPVGEGFLIAAMAQSGTGGGDNAPSEEMQKLMAELQQLDAAADALPPEQMAANVEQRVAALEKLATLAAAKDRDQWSRQLIDVLSGAIQLGHYPQGVEKLEALQKTLADQNADEDLIAHALFQRMWAQYVGQRDPNADAAKLQEKWLADLQDFVAKYPKSTDAAEALFQLGMYQEFVGKGEEATKWYQQLVANFPNANPTPKARGALWRLGALGKPMILKGAEINSGAPIDLGGSPYRGKIVLVHYWATLGERWTDDMVLLREFYAKKGGKDIEIIGVCLDDNPTTAKQYLAGAKLPWKQIFDKGGMDSRLANESGVLTLPLMILVDQKGFVANPNVHMEELESELVRLQKPAAAGAASALRPTATSR